MNRNRLIHRWPTAALFAVVMSCSARFPVFAQTADNFYGFESPDVVGAVPPGWYQLGNNDNFVANTSSYAGTQSLLFTQNNGTLGVNLPAAMLTGAVDFYAKPTTQEIANQWDVLLNAGPNMTGNGGMVAFLYPGYSDWVGSYNAGASGFDSGASVNTGAYNHIHVEWDCTGATPVLTWIWNDTLVNSSTTTWSAPGGIGSVSFRQDGWAPSGANLFLDNVTVSYPGLFGFETDTAGAAVPIGWYQINNAVGDIVNSGAYSGSQCLKFSSNQNLGGGLGFNFANPMKKGSIDFYANPTTQEIANSWNVTMNAGPNNTGNGGVVALLYPGHSNWLGSYNGGGSAFDSGCPVQTNAYNHVNVAWDCTGATPQLTWTWNNGSKNVSTTTWTAPEGISSITFMQGAAAPSGATCLLDNVIVSFPKLSYFSENFDEANPPVFSYWYAADGVTFSSAISNAHAFSPSNSAHITTSGASYFDLLLASSLPFNRNSSQGIGSSPLYVSARIWPTYIQDGTETCVGLVSHIVPQNGPPIDACPINGSDSGSTITQSFNGWRTVVLDVGALLARDQQLGLINPDEVYIDGASIMCYGSSEVYVDNVQISTTPPPGWVPPAPVSLNAGGTYRADSVLKGMVLHGAYAAIGDPVLRDWQIHPAAVRDMKRHYFNFGGPGACTINENNSLPPVAQQYQTQNQAISALLSNAQLYNFPVIPDAYMGSLYSPGDGIGNPNPLQSDMQAIVQQYKTNSYLLAWYLEDEPLLSVLPEYLIEKQWIQSVDTLHSVLATFNSQDTVDACGAAQSVIIRDMYAIQPGNASNPWSVPLQMHLAANEFPSQPVVLMDQAFSGQGYATPSVGQFQLMAYGALAQGVKGLIHFAYTEYPAYELIIQGQTSPIQNTLVDPYGNPGTLYSQISAHLGPDLMSIGDLLRTCVPAPVPAPVTTACGTMSNAIDQTIPTIATTMLSDSVDGYNIIAVYNNDPVNAQTGTLTLPASWLNGSVIVDLSAESVNITQSPTPISSPIALNLQPGDGRFLAILPSSKVAGIAQRMQALRFNATVNMVNFDVNWLQTVGLGNSNWATTVQQLQSLCNSGQAASALTQLRALDTTIQSTISNNQNLSSVLASIGSARQGLGSANQNLANWTSGNLTSSHGVTYGRVQTTLGQLLAGFTDLAYQKPPANLVAPLQQLVGLCTQHLNALPSNYVPTVDDPVTQSSLASLETSLTNLGWVQPVYTSYPLYTYP